MVDSTEYKITLDKPIGDGLICKGEVIKLSEAKYKTLCSNGYIYLEVVTGQSSKEIVKLLLDDIRTVDKLTTEILRIPLIKPINPEEDYVD